MSRSAGAAGKWKVPLRGLERDAIIVALLLVTIADRRVVLKSAALAYEREMGISRGRQPSERNAATSRIERLEKLRRILPNGRRS